MPGFSDGQPSTVHFGLARFSALADRSVVKSCFLSSGDMTRAIRRVHHKKITTKNEWVPRSFLWGPLTLIGLMATSCLGQPINRPPCRGHQEHPSSSNSVRYLIRTKSQGLTAQGSKTNPNSHEHPPSLVRCDLIVLCHSLGPNINHAHRIPSTTAFTRSISAGKNLELLT